MIKRNKPTVNPSGMSLKTITLVIRRWHNEAHISEVLEQAKLTYGVEIRELVASWVWMGEKEHTKTFWEDGMFCILIGVWTTQVPACIKLMDVYI